MGMFLSNVCQKHLVNALPANTCLNDLGGIISDMTDAEGLSPSHPHILSSLKDLEIFTWNRNTFLIYFANAMMLLMLRSLKHQKVVKGCSDAMQLNEYFMR